MNDTLKRHLFSAAQTFVAGFGIGVLPYLNNFDWSNAGRAVFFGLFLAGVRGGVKLVWEQLILPYANEHGYLASAAPKV